MQPKYNTGTRVTVRIREDSHFLGYPHLKGFNNMTGTVIECRTVVAYMAYGQDPGSPSDGPDTRLHVYTIQVEGGILLADLSEEILEEQQG